MSAHSPNHPARAFVYAPPSEPFLDVIYADDDILVLNKPSGLLSVPGKADSHRDCLEARACTAYCGARIVHRLDNATSGVMVLAMTKAAHRHLSMQFERRHTSKTYIARVWGHVADETGQVDLPLICDWPNRPKQHVDMSRGKPSQTDWRVLALEGSEFEETETPTGSADTAPAPAITRLQLTPLTGRSHQLRVHMLSIGHPILGDRFYAHDTALIAADRLQLHAQSLTLRHPADGRHCTFEAPCPF